MKKAVVVGLMVLGLCSVVRAEQDLCVEVTGRVWAKYLGYDGVVFYDGPILVTDTTLYLPYGMKVNMWTSTGLRDWKIPDEEDWGDEVDLELIFEHQRPKWVYTGSVSFFDVKDVLDVPRGDLWRGKVEVTRMSTPILRWSLDSYAGVQSHIPAKGSKPEKGTLVYVGVRQTVFETRWCDLQADASALYDDGAFGQDDGFVWKAVVDLNHPVSENFHMGVSVKAAGKIRNAEDRDVEVVPGVKAWARF